MLGAVRIKQVLKARYLRATMKNKISVVDLFCGVGGMTHGIIKSGIRVNAGIDLDGTCKYAYETNNKVKFIERNIKSFTEDELKSLYPDGHIRVLVGCAPCQPFSRHTQKNKNRQTDEKWNLLSEFGRLIRGVEPEIVSMENVPEISKEQVFKDFVALLKELKYSIFFKPVFCPTYGIPQTRTRLVLLASKLGPINLVEETHNKKKYRTVKDVIGSLEAIGDGESSKKDKIHKSAHMDLINKKRIQQSKPGGTWLDWDKDLRAKCHKKKTGESYSAVYARMEWNKPGPTITTQFFRFGTGRFGHPVQDRALSLREGALLQTFPRKYKFVEPRKSFTFRQVGIHIGNAVPVKLGTIVGKSILNHVDNL